MNVKTDVKFAQAVVEGKSLTQAAKIANPKLKDSSAAKTGSRLAKKKNVQQLINKALQKHKITIDRAIKPIADGLLADKVVVIGKGKQAFADVQPDHPTRLKASQMALKVLGADKTVNTPQTQNTNLNNEELSQAIQNNDTVELQRILFKKNEE